MFEEGLTINIFNSGCKTTYNGIKESPFSTFLVHQPRTRGHKIAQRDTSRPKPTMTEGQLTGYTQTVLIINWIVSVILQAKVSKTCWLQLLKRENLLPVFIIYESK